VGPMQFAGRSMSGPVEISAAQFFDFITAPELALVFVSLHPVHPPNRALGRRLCEVQGDEVSFGAVSMIDLVRTASPVLPFLRRGLSSCGVSMARDVLPGYYLFRRGRMLAWDLGLPNRNDAVPIARGSLLGLIAFAYCRDVAFLGTSLRIAVDEATAARLTAHFHRVVQEDCAQTSQTDASSVGRTSGPEDDLRLAYRTLGVSPHATDEEVEAAWRKLRIEFHPDRAAADPVEFKRRGRQAVHINWARDTILGHRAAARRWS
jgi:DnaJ domain